MNSTSKEPINADNLPMRTIAGVSVIDTPIVRAAQSFARQHSSDLVYNHIMRSWLLGALIIKHDPVLRSTVDLEVHAIASILHDLGWDRTPDTKLVSPDKRFEVDGAIAAREFIKSHEDGRHWDEHRVQLVWDSIALHTERSISMFKEVDVQVVSNGIVSDFAGPTLGVTAEEYAAVVSEFPKGDLKDGIDDIIIWLCHTKPETTYDTWMQAWGERYVPNYDASGKQFIDNLFAKS